jgi:hypothetical protein
VVPAPDRVGLALVVTVNLALITAAMFTLTIGRTAQQTVRSTMVEAVADESVDVATVRLGRCEVLFRWDEC